MALVGEKPADDRFVRLCLCRLPRACFCSFLRAAAVAGARTGSLRAALYHAWHGQFAAANAIGAHFHAWLAASFG